MINWVYDCPPINHANCGGFHLMLERFHVPVEDRVYVKQEKMRAATETVFRKIGLTEDDAALSADVLMLSDLRGCETHGVSNMLREYVNGYNEGNIIAQPEITTLRESPTTATMDGGGGLGLHTAPVAMNVAIEKAKKHGMASVSMRNSRHLGMAAYHAMMALEHDMIGMCMTGGGGSVGKFGMVPTFGTESRLGTNPIAWAAPADKMPPFVFDVATTQVAGNKLRLAERIGAKLEPGWITDADGIPIMEPTELPPRGEYKMLPFGGTRENGSHKGYGFASVVYILCQTLAGSGWDAPSGGGHHFMVYNIDAFTDVAKFKSDMDDFLEGLANTKPAPGHDEVVYAGLPEARETEERTKNGIPYHREVIDWFHSISGELDLGIQLP
jgi:L-2-hydroxycarboxylate dehydrogenase (NAD+)